MAFIRGPFVAEGFLQGGIGALLAITSLWVGFLLAMAWWGPDLNSLLAGGSVQFLPIRLCLYLVLGGMLVGSAGGLVAAREAA
jgi:cell division protein FtsX